MWAIIPNILLNSPVAHVEACRALGLVLNPVSVNLSLWNDTELRGVVIFERYTHCAIFCHVVGFVPRWGCKRFLWMVFDYCFVQLGVDRVFGLVASNNLTALNFIENLGFREEARIRNVYPDADQVIVVLEKANCRFLKMSIRSDDAHAN